MLTPPHGEGGPARPLAQVGARRVRGDAQPAARAGAGVAGVAVRPARGWSATAYGSGSVVPGPGGHPRPDRADIDSADRGCGRHCVVPSSRDPWRHPRWCVGARTVLARPLGRVVGPVDNDPGRDRSLAYRARGSGGLGDRLIVGRSVLGLVPGTAIGRLDLDHPALSAHVTHQAVVVGRGHLGVITGAGAAPKLEHVLSL